jgi:hypothetical protein
MRAQLGAYVQDQWTLNRFTMNLGLRYDYQNSFIPEQHLPAGRYIGERNFDQVDCVPCWKDWLPRGSVIFDVFGNGKTAVKASTGRYVTENMLVTADANNPLVTSNPSTNRAWNDLTFPAGDLSGGATTVTINNVIPPQTMFEDRVNQTDFRIIRNFRFGNTRVQAMFDIYNVFNNAGILVINTRYGTSWRRPLNILDARILKFGAQVNF